MLSIMDIGMPDRDVSENDNDWDDIVSTTPGGKWIGGVLLPILLTGYGVSCAITQHAVMTDNYISMEIGGQRAIAYGIAAISVGLLLHFHYFWANIQRLAPFAMLGKIPSLVGLIVGVGYLIVQIGIWG